MHRTLHWLAFVVLRVHLHLHRLPALNHIAHRLHADAKASIRRQRRPVPTHLAVRRVRHPRLNAVVHVAVALAVAFFVHARRNLDRQPPVCVEDTFLFLLFVATPLGIGIVLRRSLLRLAAVLVALVLVPPPVLRRMHHV